MAREKRETAAIELSEDELQVVAGGGEPEYGAFSGLPKGTKPGLETAAEHDPIIQL